jgi:hypothetical protein
LNAPKVSRKSAFPGEQNREDVLKSIKIAAIFSIFIGFAVVIEALIPRLSLDTYVIKEKHIDLSSSFPDYRILAKMSDGFGYETDYPESFYDQAAVGDELRLSLFGYCRLVRNGQVIQSRMEPLMAVLLIYASVAFLPSLIFIPQKKLLLRRLSAILVTGAELVVFAGVFYYCFVLD